MRMSLADKKYVEGRLKDLLEQWQAPIVRWTIDWGWMDAQMEGLEYNTLRINTKRSPAELLGLAMTEIRELRLGVDANDTKNMAEEVAGLFVRVVNLIAELQLDQGVESFSHISTTIEKGTHFEEWYNHMLDAMELLRKPGNDCTAVNHILTAAYDAALWTWWTATPPAAPLEVGDQTVWQWLDSAVRTEMAKNHTRPRRHGKLF